MLAVVSYTKHCAGHPSQCKKARKTDKHEKERSSTVFLFVDDIVICVENPNESIEQSF